MLCSESTRDTKITKTELQSRLVPETGLVVTKITTVTQIHDYQTVNCHHHIRTTKMIAKTVKSIKTETVTIAHPSTQLIDKFINQ